MSVTTTILGTNTKQITLSGETSYTNFINSLDSAITGMGWSQLDVTNPLYRVYNAPNLDGVTSKIAVVQIEPLSMRLYVTSFETWNSSSHVGTNETWNYNRAGMMGFAYSNCDVIVMASPRWLVLQTFIVGQASVWSGVFELTRDIPEDTAAAGYPCWCWTSSCLIYTQPSNATLGNTVASTVSLPRTRTGLTGSAAATNNSLQTYLTRIGYVTAGGNSGQQLPSLQYSGWSPTKRTMMTPRVMVGANEPHGTIIGLKLVANIGNPYSYVTVPVDSSYEYNLSGTQTNFWILGANPTTLPANVLTTNSVPGSGYVTQLTSGTGMNYVTAVGTGFYASTTTGVVYIDGSSSTLQAPITVTSSIGNTLQVIYDNAQYVWAATAAGVYRIDTLNGNTVVQVSGSSSLSIAWLVYDGTYIWAATRTAQTNLTVSKIDPVGMTVLGTYSLANATSGSIASMCSDGTNIWVLALAGNGYIYKITPSGTVSTIVSNGLLNGIGAGGIWYNGQYIVVSGFNGSNNSMWWYTLAGTIVSQTTVGGAPSITGIGPNYRAPISKVGMYDATGVINNWQLMFFSSSNGFTTANSTFVQASVGASTYAWYDWTSDGNRLYGISWSTNYFFLYTNFYHADETTTTYGRLLLPQ